jgi:hypothetical protein
MPNVEKEKEKDKIIDLPSDGPDVEVTLPEEAVKEGPQDVTVPDVKPEGEVEIKEEAPKKETETKELIQEAPKEEAPKEEAPKEKELEEYGEGVKKRIAKLTKRMRESERQRDEATRYARSVLGEQKTLKERLSKLDTGYVSEMESRITSGLEAAKGKLTTAREAGNMTDEVDAQKEIAKLGYEEARLAEMKINQEAKKPKEEKRELNQQANIRQEQSLTPKPDARATEWAQKNQWFGSNNAMTYTAFDMHRKLVEEEGYDPQSEDYYGELDRRIKLEFPNKFGNVTEQTTKPTQTVASATRNVKRGTGRTTVKLTSSQVAIAKKLNVPLEEYAKQLNVIEE